jgi:hypothetical protein
MDPMVIFFFSENKSITEMYLYKDYSFVEMNGNDSENIMSMPKAIKTISQFVGRYQLSIDDTTMLLQKQVPERFYGVLSLVKNYMNDRCFKKPYDIEELLALALIKNRINI